ncbi:hypothetical protein LEP1GSC068_2505 [Leptospira sp. Fiocruz LV3954]|nr:hypothetical protein LEP1GSC068_2505 [Leptospira sp. Fiocruz LV3954]EMI63748.1 hypothetical protein LEP1GSC076_2193 [Leptospira sp. Fiocruz LV4135]
MHRSHLVRDDRKRCHITFSVRKSYAEDFFRETSRPALSRLKLCFLQSNEAQERSDGLPYRWDEFIYLKYLIKV